MIFNWPTPDIATLPQLGTPGIIWPDLGAGPAPPPPPPPPVLPTTTGTGEKQDEWNDWYIHRKRLMDRQEQEEMQVVLAALAQLGIWE